MMKMTKNLLLGVVAVCGSTFQAVACTGISLTSRDGSYVQALSLIHIYRGKSSSHRISFESHWRILLAEIQIWHAHLYLK